MIPFNKPYLHGRELVYIAEAVASGKISGDGVFTKRCHSYFESKYGFQKALMTTSCTDALEMAAILLNIKEGDEVIMPSFTFVSTANAFALRGAKIIFADSSDENPNMDPNSVERLVSEKTKAIIVVHYAGVACDMDAICSIALKFSVPVIEDAAQAIDSYYKDIPLGRIGSMGAFSFHETKNIISGEGGLLALNDKRYNDRAEIIREKGTNRSAFFRGESDKYGWVDIGSSFLPSDIISAYLYAQLECMDEIQRRRLSIWHRYFNNFKDRCAEFGVKTPHIPEYGTNNAHMFYLLCKNENQRDKLISDLKAAGVHAVFHYVPLHSSYFYEKIHGERALPNCDRYFKTLVRLPLYYEMKDQECDYVADSVLKSLAGI